MNYEQEIKDKMGHEVYNLLKTAIKSGFITKIQMQKLGSKIHPYVNGVFVNKNREDIDLDLWDLMLDSWYNNELFMPDVHGQDRIKAILCDLQLFNLVFVINGDCDFNQIQREETEMFLTSCPKNNDKKKQHLSNILNPFSTGGQLRQIPAFGQHCAEYPLMVKIEP